MGRDRPKPPPWDERAALGATGGDADLARELLMILADGLANDLVRITRFFQAADWPALAEATHHLRGATSYCGVPALDGALRDLEQAALVGNRDEIEQGAMRVELEVERLRNWIGLETRKLAD